jgi:hypothetical protein
MRPLVSNRLHRAIALVALLAYLPACTEWHPLPGPQPARGLSGEHDLLLTLKDGSRVTLLQARVQGDSLVGLAAPRSRKVRRAIALTEVREVADHRIDEGRSAIAMVGGVVGVGLLALVAMGIAVSESMSFEIACQPAGCTP